MAKHEKMYAASPKLAKKDDGRVEVEKPKRAEQADKVSAGVDGEPIDARHLREAREMHDKHAAEMTKLHNRHAEEAAVGDGQGKLAGTEGAKVEATK